MNYNIIRVFSSWSVSTCVPRHCLEMHGNFDTLQILIIDYNIGVGIVIWIMYYHFCTEKGRFSIIYQLYHLKLCSITVIWIVGIYINIMFLVNKYKISLIFNTDGIPVFKSSNLSFWPLYLLIIELPYKLRYV